jgi:hypothetical protein
MAKRKRHIDRADLIPGLTTEARTDADGRFKIYGLGKDWLAAVNVTAAGIDTDLTVMTRKAPDVRAYPGAPEILTIRGTDFSLKLASEKAK